MTTEKKSIWRWRQASADGLAKANFEPQRAAQPEIFKSIYYLEAAVPGEHEYRPRLKASALGGAEIECVAVTRQEFVTYAFRLAGNEIFDYILIDKAGQLIPLLDGAYRIAGATIEFNVPGKGQLIGHLRNGNRELLVADSLYTLWIDS